MAAVEAPQQIGDHVQAVDAYRFEVGAQNRFDGALPAALHAQLLRDARLEVERLSLQPLRNLARHFAESGLLQRLGGDLRAERLLPARAHGIECLRLFALAIARERQFRQQLRKLVRGLLPGLARQRGLLPPRSPRRPAA